VLYDTWVSLDITTSDVRVVVYQNKRIKKWTSNPLPDGLVRDGVIRDPVALGLILDGLFKSLKLQRNRVVSCVTGLPFIYRTITMPGIGQVNPEAIERAARADMAITAEDMYLVWQISRIQEKEKETDYFVVGIPNNVLDPLMTTLQAAKIKPFAIDIKPLALARITGSRNALIISMEKDFFDVVLVYEGLVRVIHSVGTNIRPDDVVGIVNEFVDGLNIAVKSFHSDYPENIFPPDTPVVVSGEFSSGTEVLKLIQEATGHPVKIINPTLHTPVSMPPGVYAANLGLISKYLKLKIGQDEYSDIRIDLLDALKKRKSSMYQYLYAGAAVFLILITLAIFKINDWKADVQLQIDDLQGRFSAETQKLTELREAGDAAAKQKDLDTEKYRNLEKQLISLSTKNNNLTEIRKDFASDIENITGSIPTTIDFTAITLSKKEISLDGIAADSPDVLELVKTLESINGFSEAKIVNIEPTAGETGVNFKIIIVAEDQA